MHRNRPTAASNVDRPENPSNSAAAASGSSNRAWTALRAASHALAGSSSTEGVSPISWPTNPRNMPWVWTTWRTTSRAVHSAHGDGLVHRSAGTAAILSAKAAASRAYRCDTSLMGETLPTAPEPLPQRRQLVTVRRGWKWGNAMTVQDTSASVGMARRIPLSILLVPFVVAVAASTAADWIWPSLVTDRPLLLIALSSKNRFLLLTAPQLGIVAFFVVGFLRLIFTDPVTYLMGRQYGDRAITWIEQKTSTAPPGRSFIRKAERLFGRAAPLFILIAPSAMWCVLAGAARMKVWVFVTCNVVGTVGRLALFWIAADAFREPLEHLLNRLESAQVPLLVVTISLGVIHTIRSRRRRPVLAETDALPLTPAVVAPEDPAS